MKKIISFILTLAMVMSLSSVPVFAAEITSTDEGSNSASQSVTATYIPEATWGTATNQSASGSLTDAIAAAKDDNSITYIQLQKDLYITDRIDIAGGTFTFDFNGKTIALADDSSDYEAIYVHETSSEVTFTDSASKGGVEATNQGTCVYIEYGSTVAFNGGTYQGIIGMMVYSSTVTINNGDFVGTGDNLADGIRCMNDATMTINGGTFQGTRSAITNYGNLTITGGTFSEGTWGHIAYDSGGVFSPNKLDLSGYTGKITKLTVYMDDSSVSKIGDDNIKLPTGYGMSEDGSNVVTALDKNKKYSIISTTGESQDAIIKGVSVEVDSKTYTSGNVTLTPDSGNVTIKVSGTGFSKLDDNDNKLLYVDGSSVGVSEASGWTVDTTNNTASKTFELSKFQNCTTAFEIKYSNDGGSTYASSGVYIQYQNETVSAGITWGAMNFTYSDEQVDDSDKGWTCEKGANTVKVENSGTVNVAAGISYKQAEGYTAISGTFDKSSETLGTGDSATFTLTLSGKPDAKLSGATIGTVTVTIKKVESLDLTGVADEDKLNEMMDRLTAKLNAGATDIVINLGDNYNIGGGPNGIFIAWEITSTMKESDAVDGTINLTVSGAKAASVWASYSGNTKLKTITLPDATVFGSECFNNCTNLTAVYAPSVTKIVAMPFDGCDNLTTLELTATGSFTFEKDGNTSWNSGTSNINLKLNADKQNDVIQNEDGTGTWNGNTFKSITFVDSND